MYKGGITEGRNWRQGDLSGGVGKRYWGSATVSADGITTEGRDTSYFEGTIEGDLERD